jgi:hypothetical protein
MLARSCLRSTRAVGAVRNGAVNTTKVRQQTILESDYEDTIHCQMCWKGSIELDFELTVDIVACRIFLELFNRGFNPLPIERSWISCYCCGYWIAGLVLSSLWRSSTGHDTNRRRVSFQWTFNRLENLHWERWHREHQLASKITGLHHIQQHY